ncbi:MAG: glycosyltransferase N-terminal domain-containing protein [Bacteroidales bacterium]|nr:glycosyltransferase N-terminal domain-containing protein [Bacteroidales bacterium]
MVRLVYGVTLRIYNAVLLLASLFNKKARLWVDGRKGLFDKLGSELEGKSNIVWFHCASLGEFEQGRPVIEEYKRKKPNIYILLTFFSPSGYEIRKNYEGADSVFYLPLDSKRNANRFINIVNPSIVIFVKYEFWLNYLQQLWQRNIPVFLISANFRRNQWFFKWYGKSFRKIFKFYTHLFVQNKSSEEILSDFGISDVTVAGDTRFDRVSQLALNPRPIQVAESFKNGKFLIVAGSTWIPDEEILCKYINESNNDLKWILAPHEIGSAHIDKIESLLHKSYFRFSEASTSDVENASVMIIDNIGMLSFLYAYGEIAYVGGGFGVGIHNILEPACFGIPIIFGPTYHKFQEASDLVNEGGAFSIGSYEELMNRLNNLLISPETIAKSREIAKSYVNNNNGATSMIVNNLLSF